MQTIKPAANNVFSWFLSQDLATQAETVALTAAVLYFGPSVLRFIAGTLQVPPRSSIPFRRCALHFLTFACPTQALLTYLPCG